MKTKTNRKFRFRVQDVEFKQSGWCGNRRKCVSVAVTKQGVAVRDTKDATKQTLFFTKTEWKAFTKGIESGQFNA
jgi:Domain of unknown function (DUF397)